MSNTAIIRLCLKVRNKWNQQLICFL